jgi:hypothetical protein
MLNPEKAVRTMDEATVSAGQKPTRKHISAGLVSLMLVGCLITSTLALTKNGKEQCENLNIGTDCILQRCPRDAKTKCDVIDLETNTSDFDNFVKTACWSSQVKIPCQISKNNRGSLLFSEDECSQICKFFNMTRQ